MDVGTIADCLAKGKAHPVLLVPYAERKTSGGQASLDYIGQSRPQQHTAIQAISPNKPAPLT